MLILVLFGYKQSKIFCIDCLTATLIDTIWLTCLKEINNNLKAKEDQHNKEKVALAKKISRHEARIIELDKLLKEEEEKLATETQTTGDKKKAAAKQEPKKEAPKPGKKGKEVVPSNPLEAEKFELTKDIEKSKESIVKYDEKLEKLKAAKQKIADIEKNENLIVELFDKQGERKFVKTKADTIANTFLTDKNTYVVGYYLPAQQNEEEQVQVLEIEGFCVRSVEEDEGAIDEPLIVKKDDKKKGKKGK
ncbi:hypothetical protein TTHERM_00636870 (macronuclear) [Tetrahymena thermophila SB210]|uniref:Uncharacterized protein n=1 Tax=Tetrahymena thermophila (strain SB210) TaxID=312017 RepID=Q22HL6_TETTS|nr:hypothetical protein TTHERM_00636870 [Tetrahymena thermophila SB210]EAR84685.2 hypothetical protein TTHERM_00636870 [Tetrahymena thermophila SB210]|eukprot:XP_001032348.2 hypothetical protein TTHERM_00636870 [Tetrahymena thermophila SB210]